MLSVLICKKTSLHKYDRQTRVELSDSEGAGTVISLYPRYDPAEFWSYHQNDFTGKIWESRLSVGGYGLPKIARLSTQDTGPIVWQCLSVDRFRGIIATIQEQLGYESLPPKLERMRLATLDLIFSPDKKFSIGALAAPKINVELLDLHGRAVDQTLAFGRQFLRTRRVDPSKFCVEVLRFPHPTSARNDPQVHEHVSLCWLLDGCEDQGALHGYPLFFHRRALESYYHRALANLLLGAGRRAGILTPQ